MMVVALCLTIPIIVLASNRTKTEIKHEQAPIQAQVFTPIETVAMPKKIEPLPAPASSLSEWLLKLRSCEQGAGGYKTNTGNGFYGAYQFMISTWDRIAPKAGRPDLVGVRPDLASEADQDFMITQNTILSSGGLSSQNPGCYASTGISNKPPKE